MMSDQARKTIIDCDGVLADWTGYLLKQLDVGLTVDDVYEFKLRNVLRDLKGKDVARRADAICSNPGFTASQPLLPWAQELVRLSDEAGPVMVLTSPWMTRGWYDARIGWLKDNLGIHQDNVMVGKLKWWVDGDLFIDDKPSNVISYATERPHRRAVLLAWPYNDGVELPANARRLTPDELLTNLRAGLCGW